MRPYLLDANVLIALAFTDHAHHHRAATWLAGVERFALCPIVEGALVRFLLRVGESAATASRLLTEMHAHPKCQVVNDDVSYRDVDLRGIHGHRQVTDVYLVALATAHGGRLATFDRAIAALRPEGCVLIP